MIEYKNKKYVCHLDLGLPLFRKKWQGVIICYLSDTPIRTLELQRIVKGISQKMLTENLRELEEEGIVHRKIYPEVPPRVEYSLTPKGMELLPALKIIEDWTAKHYEIKKVED